MVSLEAHELGVVVAVRAQAGARRYGVVGEQQGMLKVAVTQAPERGKANRAIVELLSKALAVKKSQIELLSGATSSKKRFLIGGVSVEELAARIAGALEQAE